MLQPLRHILVGLDMLSGTSIRIVDRDPRLGVAIAAVTDQEALELSSRAHDFKRCGGYELLGTESSFVSPLQQLRDHVDAEHDRAFRSATNRALFDFNMPVAANAVVQAAVSLVSPNRLGETIIWYSGSFRTRYERDAAANEPVFALKAKLDEIVKGVPGASVKLIDHRETRQKSIRVRLEGTARPNEVLVLGGHLDSINQDFWDGFDGDAPGADDNASGVSTLVETLRVLVTQPRTERSLEFFFYAAEETGLIGSSEIAADYKRNGAQVVGAVQFDMTLYPGSGPLVLGSMTDYTSAWLRNWMETANRLYVGARVEEDECGYGCSDHASWFRQGYPTVMPFEARFDDMNKNLHTANDRIDARSSFDHSAMFAKLAVALALELGNSTDRQP